jgi:polyhydroxyalkanoate synthesis repressor PhaR
MADTDRVQSDIKPPAGPPVVVKKYANRRLYNTETSCYITLENLAAMVRESRDFVVYDAKSGEDITRGVLTQIIVEEEGKGRNLLPTNFLRQLIGFYGDSMQSLVPKYLEQSMEVLAQQQDQMRNAVQRTMGSLFPFGGTAVSEMNRQNLAIMERALSLFSPFHRGTEDQPEKDTELAALRAEAEELRKQVSETAARAAEAVGLHAELAAERAKSAQAEQQKAELAKLQAEVETQRRKLAEAAGLQTELAAERAKSAQAEQQKAELAKLQAEVETQRRKLAEAAGLHAELDAERAKSAQSAQQKTELTKLQAEVETQRHKLAEAAGLERQIASLQRELESLRTAKAAPLPAPQPDMPAKQPPAQAPRKSPAKSTH